MKKALLLILAILVVAPAAHSAYYNIQMGYEARKGFTMNGLSLSASGPDNLIQAGEHTAKIISFNSSILYSHNFSMHLSIHPYIEGEQEITFDGEADITLNLPYYPSAALLQIYDSQGNIALSADLSEYAICNQDGFCDIDENKEDCPEDCIKSNVLALLSKEPQQTEHQETLNATTAPAELQEYDKKPSLLSTKNIAIAAIILLILIMLITIARKKPVPHQGGAYYR